MYIIYALWEKHFLRYLSNIFEAKSKKLQIYESNINEI